MYETEIFDSMKPALLCGQSDDGCNKLDEDLMNYLGHGTHSRMCRDEVDPGDFESSGTTGDSESITAANNDISATCDAHAETRQQTCSKRRSLSKCAQSKPQSRARKNKAADDKNDPAKVVGTPRVVLHGLRSLDRCADISAKQSSHDLSAILSDSDLRSDDDDDDGEIENVHAYSKTKSKSQKKVSKTVSKVKRSSGCGHKTTADTGKIDQDISKSGNATVTSVKLLRVVRSGNDCSAEDSDIAKALEERNRKNAEMAKLNRMKKKAYLEQLEEELKDSKKKIDDLCTSLKEAEGERDVLKEEVDYLKAVLANQSVLGELLKNIPHVSGASFSSSLSRKRTADDKNCPHTAQKQARTSAAGVCLHVDGGGVSLELCRHCAGMAYDHPVPLHGMSKYLDAGLSLLYAHLNVYLLPAREGEECWENETVNSSCTYHGCCCTRQRCCS